MHSIIYIQNAWHLGDNIINFIFFYNIKDYIETNNIIIHYYCYSKYHTNLLEFNCSNNIKIFDYENKGYILWQGGETPYMSFIEDHLCNMFNIFLRKYNMPNSVDLFEYSDLDLFTRYNNLDDKYKNIDILIINSTPLSGQYNYNKSEWDMFIIKLSTRYSVAVSEKVNDTILSLDNMSVKNIASIALKTKIIIAINTGPSIPLYNTHILNNVDVIYLFGDGGHSYKTRKIKCTGCTGNINELMYLLY